MTSRPTVILAAMTNWRRSVTIRAAATVALALGAVACAGGDDDAATSASATTTGLTACAEDRHVVAFDYFGTVTVQADNLGAWLADPVGAVPPARPGVADVANAYKSLGYEIIYLTTAPSEITVAERPIRDSILDWLLVNGFPIGDDASLWVWDGTHTPMRGIASEFDRLVSEGASIDAAYTDNEDKAFAFKTAVPSDHVFTIGTASMTTGVTPVPNDDMVAHAAEVAAQSPVCASA